MKKPLVLGIYADPFQKPWFARLLSILPFIVIALAWETFAQIKQVQDPGNRMFPTLLMMAQAMHQLAFVPQPFTGEYVFWRDTLASLKLLLAGVAIGSVAGLFGGLYTASYPSLRAMFVGLMIALSVMVIPIFQPVINHFVGFDELGKITLIVLGITFVIARVVFQAVVAIPNELRVKASTLGLKGISLVHRMILPTVLPNWIMAIRVSLGAAWIFLIMSELMKSNAGLGFQVNANTRHLNMDIILPIGLWTIFLAFSLDWLLKTALKKFFPHFSK